VSHFVLDASVILTWCFPDEETRKAQEISELIAAGQRVAVPSFWRHEILNALLVGERRKRLIPDLNRKRTANPGVIRCGRPTSESY